MSRPTENELESFRQRCQDVALSSGVEVECAMIDDRPDGSIRADILHCTSDLSFEILERLSEAAGSTDINLSCDLGTSSDHTHDRCISVGWPSFEVASQRLRSKEKS